MNILGRQSRVLLSRVAISLMAGLSPLLTEGASDQTAPGGSFLRTPVAGPEIRGADRSRPAAATRLLRGQKLDYGVWFDPTVWSGMWAWPTDGVENADLVFLRPLIRVYSVAEPFPTSFSNLGDGFINTLTQSVGRPPAVLLREIRRINGNDVLALELEANDGLEYARIFAYLFSNDTETIDLIAYGQSAMDSEREAVEHLLDGLVFTPPIDAGSTGHLSYRRRGLEPPEPTPERIKGNVCPPILRTRVEPVYPEAARRSRETGVAILEAIIGADGGVSDLIILKPTREPLLDEAAVRAVSQWEYEPATKDGKPVSVYLTVTVNFQLHRDEPTAKK